MSRSLPHTLLLGDPRLDEFAAVAEWLRAHDRGGLRQTPDLAGARELVRREEWLPDLVIVLQSWPDQFPPGEFHELLTLFPLARLVCCYGPWCDSDGRTRSIWPLAVRVPATAAVPRLEQEWALLQAQEQAAAPLPLTASRTEIFEFDFGQHASGDPHTGKVVVISADRAWREMMQRQFGVRGASAEGDAEPPALVLFDADPWNEERAEALAAIRPAVPAGRLIALVGFPRPDLEAELRRGGADEVRCKLTPCTSVGAAADQTPPSDSLIAGAEA